MNMRMFVVMASVVLVMVVMAMLVGISVLVMVVVMVAIGGQERLGAGLQIGERRLGVIGTSTGAAHSSDLHGLDFQFVSRQPLQIGAAALALAEGPLEQHLAATLAAASDTRWLNNLQVSPRGQRPFRADIEAEPHGVGKHSRQLANFQHDSDHPPAASLSAGDFNDLLGDSQFVHEGAPPTADCSGRPRANARREGSRQRSDVGADVILAGSGGLVS
jgi:hypothetical protein